MDKFLKNQKYIAISLYSFIIISFSIWYFGFYQKLTVDHKKLLNTKKSLKSQLATNKKMAKRINDLNQDWNVLNEDFEYLINKIPKKSSYDRLTTDLFKLINRNGLKIKDFSPSNFALETKNIIKPNTGEEIQIEKIPIDITVTGSFIDFGKLLDSMIDSYYQMTTSDIDIVKEEGGLNQRIKFITYIYTHDLVSKPTKKKVEVLKDRKEKIKLKETRPSSKNLVKKANRPVDAPDDIPDWMFEPITEGGEVTAEQIIQPEKIEQTKNIEKVTNVDEKEESFIGNVYHKMVVTDVKVCREVKNNSPLYTGTRFSTDIGRIHCYSSINNNSGKSNIIYHIWYMNGTLVAKVRIRVAKGEGVASFSNRDINSSDKGKWKVEITDSDKKILDTIIFELV